MRDLLDTIIPIGKPVVKRVLQKSLHRFNEKLEKHRTITREESETIHHVTKYDQLTKYYQEKIDNVLMESSSAQETVDYVLEHIWKLRYMYNLTDENDKELIFNQIMIFMNHLYRKFRSKYIFNTLNKNDYWQFNEKTIWSKMDNLMQKEKNSSSSGCCCIHYTLLFKQIFDELEKKLKLWMANYLYVQKTRWLHHAGLVVTFKWENYLVDSSSFNWKFMQPVDELWGLYDRMEPVSLLRSEDIPENSIQEIKDKYSKHDYEWYAVALKSSDDLLSVLKSIPPKSWSFSEMYKSKLLNTTLWLNYRIYSKWILVLNTIFYHFDHVLTKEELDAVSDDQLLDYLLKSVSYKTKLNDDRKITIFDFERKKIQGAFSYFSDKIDYSALRKVLTENYSF